ncbi:fumarylacetoacetate hydrolase family protein [Gordonia hirsuta DSM 44140 = NBRC 16056]|uniref:Fumarylacetoacetate hydrolase family protein n=1 Tax=Gordonia hirsuta DSM 44140 = NBRC 16056 TaxID=1121927 RepID=L7LDZ6_9ACTN|nr:fumarylacetoacetate hydrolase family protein [Gordonia hirsuta]GAC58292.1 fumarylacetoacetate hydrolase family protein [Gordonia hirsuta DSM 44140 = NBRC 16056]
MYLATIRTGNTTHAVKRVESDSTTDLLDLGYPDLGALLADPQGLAKAAAATDGTRYALDTADFAPPVLDPAKVICVAHNYGEHHRVLGVSVPEAPRLSTKFSSALIGANDPLILPRDAHKMQANVELGIIIGSAVGRGSDDAAQAIAGFTVINDVADRDLGFEFDAWGTAQIWDRSTPTGPWLVTPDELTGGTAPQLTLTATVDGTQVQSGQTADLHFDPVHVVRHVARFADLQPGDVIATGTPPHTGDPVYLAAGQTVVTEITGLGVCRSTVRV